MLQKIVVHVEAESCQSLPGQRSGRPLRCGVPIAEPMGRWQERPSTAQWSGSAEVADVGLVGCLSAG